MRDNLSLKYFQGRVFLFLGNIQRHSLPPEKAAFGMEQEKEAVSYDRREKNIEISRRNRHVADSRGHLMWRSAWCCLLALRRLIWKRWRREVFWRFWWEARSCTSYSEFWESAIRGISSTASVSVVVILLLVGMFQRAHQAVRPFRRVRVDGERSWG